MLNGPQYSEYERFSAVDLAERSLPIRLIKGSLVRSTRNIRFGRIRSTPKPIALKYPMNETVANLEPSEVWTCFEKLNAVPRPSKKEERVIAFAKKFGEDLGLETIVDPAGNVIIRKLATAGKESVTPVILQAHLDMVHQKNADTDFDFNTQGIVSVVDGDWVKAKGTTLGADNGMGVASIMAVLQSDSISHGPLEALFTIDEETGMTGAMNLQPGLLQGKLLLNTDTEEDGELTIGCAGGVDSTVHWEYEQEEVTEGGFNISITGLKGGHSGVDIHLGRGNANKLMNRVLMAVNAAVPIRISALRGGSLRNAIPRESFAHITFDMARLDDFVDAFDQVVQEIKFERAISEPDLTITQVKAYPAATTQHTMSYEDEEKLYRLIDAAPNGVDRMSESVPGMVETSTNLAKVEVSDGTATVHFLTRSSVESARDALSGRIENLFELVGISCVHSGDYPGWEPKADSKIVSQMKQIYENLFGKPATISAIHAGLECGIIGSHYPDLDMVSFGPTIRHPHSPDEKVHIESVQRYWKFLTAVLESVT